MYIFLQKVDDSELGFFDEWDGDVGVEDWVVGHGDSRIIIQIYDVTSTNGKDLFECKHIFEVLHAADEEFRGTEIGVLKYVEDAFGDHMLLIHLRNRGQECFLREGEMIGRQILMDDGHCFGVDSEHEW